MTYRTTFRGVLATSAALVVLSVAGCSNDQPLISADPAPLLDGGVLIGSGHEEAASTPTNSTAGGDSAVARGPGTIGSGH